MVLQRDTPTQTLTRFQWMCMRVYVIGCLHVSKQFITKRIQKNSTMTNDMNEETSNYKIV